MLPTIDFHPNYFFFHCIWLGWRREIKFWSGDVCLGVWLFACMRETEVRWSVVFLVTGMHRWLTTNREMYSSLLASHAYQVAICWEFYNEAASFMWTEALIPNTSAEWHMVNSALFVTFFLWCISLILLTFFSNQLLLSLLFAYILYFSLLFYSGCFTVSLFLPYLLFCIFTPDHFLFLPALFLST